MYHWTLVFSIVLFEWIAFIISALPHVFLASKLSFLFVFYGICILRHLCIYWCYVACPWNSLLLQVGGCSLEVISVCVSCFSSLIHHCHDFTSYPRCNTPPHVQCPPFPIYPKRRQTHTSKIARCSSWHPSLLLIPVFLHHFPLVYASVVTGKRSPVFLHSHVYISPPAPCISPPFTNKSLKSLKSHRPPISELLEIYLLEHAEVERHAVIVLRFGSLVSTLKVQTRRKFVP